MSTPAQPPFPIADHLEKVTGKSGQALVHLLAQHLAHIGRRGNHPHSLPALIGVNRKKESRVCPVCQQAADVVLLIEAVLLGNTTATPAVETEGPK
jgi:hypothetical protein